MKGHGSAGFLAQAAAQRLTGARAVQQRELDAANSHRGNPDCGEPGPGRAPSRKPCAPTPVRSTPALNQEAAEADEREPVSGGGCAELGPAAPGNHSLGADSARLPAVARLPGAYAHSPVGSDGVSDRQNALVNQTSGNPADKDFEEEGK